MIRLYERLTKECRTINQVNRVHISLGNRLSPSALFLLRREFVRRSFLKIFANKIYRLLGKEAFFIKIDHAGDWLQGLDDLASKSGKTEPEPFVRKRISPHSLLFSDQSTPSEHKTLVVCFTGAVRRMMMPTGVFLQHFDAKKVDIVLIIYPERPIGYRKGLKGVGKDFKDTLSNLPKILPATSYARTVAIGTSGGAVPALLAAIRFNYAAVLAVGINSPFNTKWQNELGFSLNELAAEILEKSQSCSAVYFIHGIDHEQDKKSALDWQDLLKTAVIVAIENEDNPVGHLALVPLLQSGKLRGFLSETLGL